MMLEKYVVGENKNGAHAALSAMMQGVDVGKSYADMIRLRLSGKVAGECADTYYVALEKDRAVSRHWNGWGKHPDAIGNWGNFYTDPAFRGKGVGGALLHFWQKDFETLSEKPLCFLCSAATKELTDLYRRFGFRPAIEGTEYGSLYCPVGDAPERFRDFYTRYYRPSRVLYHRAASIGYRHEIDCLLKFALKDLGLSFGIGEEKGVEALLLSDPKRVGMLFSEDGHCVGWSLDGETQVFPLYESAEICQCL